VFQNNAKKWWKVDILLNALSALNYPVSIECVDTTETNSPVVYNFDENRIRIASSDFATPFGYRRALARGLVYAFDNARAKVDYSDIDHLVCTSIRGFNISGECDLWSKWTDYIGEDPLGIDMYSKKQKCIRHKVMENISVESQYHSTTSIEASMDRVWDKCFRDHWPFTAEPHMDTRFRDSPYVRPT
jgi:inner membrane protease ATP23